MNALKKYLHDLLTEPNNQTFCPVRVLALLGAGQYLGMAWVHFFKHGIFDPQGFAVGLGALLGGVGAALGMKKDTPKV